MAKPYRGRSRRPLLALETLENRELMAGGVAQAAVIGMDRPATASPTADTVEVSIGTAVANALNNAATSLLESLTPALRDLALSIALPRFTPSQRHAVDRLVVDFAKIGRRAQLPQSLITNVQTSALAALGAAGSIDRLALNGFNQTVRRILADGSISTAERTQLTDNLKVVLKSASVPDAQSNQLITDIRAVLDQVTLSRRDLLTIRNDLQFLTNAFHFGSAGRTR